MTKPLSAVRKVLLVICFGLAAAILFAFPIEFTLLAYVVICHLGIKDSFGISIYAGLFSLTLLPLAIVGQALHVSWQRAREKENEGPSAEVETNAPLPEITPFDTKDVVAAWKTSLDVQQHFNDLELRIRNFAITLLVAVMGGTALALKEHYTVQVAHHQVSLAIIVLLAGMLGWFAFYFMDRHWYHRLLIGSVMHTIDSIEKPYGKFKPLGLSQRIGEHSAIPVWTLHEPKGKRTHWIEIHSTEKIDLFYSVGLIFLIILIAGATAITNAS
jgi:hypothetical protein